MRTTPGRAATARHVTAAAPVQLYGDTHAGTFKQYAHGNRAKCTNTRHGNRAKRQNEKFLQKSLDNGTATVLLCNHPKRHGYRAKLEP